MIVSICTDFEAFKASGLIDKRIIDNEVVQTGVRGRIEGSGGIRVCRNGNLSMVVLSDLNDLSALTDLPYITLTNYEAIFGYTRQVEIEENVLQFGEPITVVEAEHERQIIIGYEDDLENPIYRVERTVTETTRTVTDEEENEIEVPGRPIIEYIVTNEVDGYHSKPIYGSETVPEYTYTKTNPTMESVGADPEMRELYDQVYPRETIQIETEDGVTDYTPSKLFSIPAGSSVEHLL